MKTDKEANSWTCLDNSFCYAKCSEQCETCKKFDERVKNNTQ